MPSRDPQGLPVLRLSPWIGCLAAIAIAGLIALLIGIPVLKLKGHYLAMATLGFGVIIEKIVRGTKAFGGADGLSNLDPFPLLPGLTVAGGKSLRVINFYIAWGIVILGFFLLTNLVSSRSGRALRALHDGEEAASAMGVNTAKYKVEVFMLGAIFAAIAGVFMSRYNGSIGPGEAGVMKSVRYVAIVAVGGMANLWGTLISGTLLNFLSLRGVFGTYDDAVFGAILILVMLFAPDGFLRGSILKIGRGAKA
jgi:branched-chain amino acid transport system permease protein